MGTVEIGGEIRPINLGRNALRDFEKITGKSIMNGASIASFEAIQTLYFVGLKWGLYKNDGKEPIPNFSLIQIGDWLDDSKGLDAKIYELLTEALPKNVKAVEKAAK